MCTLYIVPNTSVGVSGQILNYVYYAIHITQLLNYTIELIIIWLLPNSGPLRVRHTRLLLVAWVLILASILLGWISRLKSINIQTCFATNLGLAMIRSIISNNWFVILISQIHTIKQLKYHLHSCSTKNIALGRGLEVNKALHLASCYILNTV